jgi:hypothetical protein
LKEKPGAGGKSKSMGKKGNSES